MIIIKKDEIIIGVISGVVAGMILIISTGITRMIYIKTNLLNIIFETFLAFVILMIIFDYYLI